MCAGLFVLTHQVDIRMDGWMDEGLDRGRSRVLRVFNEQEWESILIYIVHHNECILHV